jgi:hypothetical protein
MFLLEGGEIRMPNRQQAVRSRRSRLAAAVHALRERFGPQIIRCGEITTLPSDSGWAALSTGSLGLDLLVGGLPRGAVTEYAGEEGAGSETLAITALARCQQAGGFVMLLDAEGAADPAALLTAGVDLTTLILACPISAHEAWSTLLALSRSGALDLIVLDLPALSALPGTFAGGSPARALTRLRLALRGRPTTVLVTNEPEPTWWATRSPVIAETASLRIALYPQGPRFAPHGGIAALRTTAMVLKFHGLPLGSFVRLEMTAQGPQCAAELLDLGRRTGCVKARQGSLVVIDQFVGRSPNHVLRQLDADPELATHLEAAIRAAWNMPPQLTAGAAL